MNPPDEDSPVVSVERLRRRLQPDRDGRIRARTIAPSPFHRGEVHGPESALPLEPFPKTREDCLKQPRPCPFVSCEFHLYLDVNPTNGAIKLNFPHLEVWEMKETCALDVSDRGMHTLEDVGAVMNVTRERIRQIEWRALKRIREKSQEDEFPVPEPPVGNQSGW